VYSGRLVRPVVSQLTPADIVWLGIGLLGGHGDTSWAGDAAHLGQSARPKVIDRQTRAEKKYGEKRTTENTQRPSSVPQRRPVRITCRRCGIGLMRRLPP